MADFEKGIKPEEPENFDEIIASLQERLYDFIKDYLNFSLSRNVINVNKFMNLLWEHIKTTR